MVVVRESILGDFECDLELSDACLSCQQKTLTKETQVQIALHLGPITWRWLPLRLCASLLLQRQQMHSRKSFAQSLRKVSGGGEKDSCLVSILRAVDMRCIFLPIWRHGKVKPWSARGRRMNLLFAHYARHFLVSAGDVQFVLASL